MYIVGQLFGIVAIILGFVSYQMSTKRGILIILSATAVAFCVHYFLIGAISGMAMNFVNIVRNVVYDKRTSAGKNGLAVPFIFASIQAIVCFITWEAWYSVFILFGLIINTVCVSLPDPQKVRKSILVTSPMVLTYDVFAHSIGGSIYEAVAIVSAVLGIIRNSKSKTES